MATKAEILESYAIEVNAINIAIDEDLKALQIKHAQEMFDLGLTSGELLKKAADKKNLELQQLEE